MDTVNSAQIDKKTYYVKDFVNLVYYVCIFYIYFVPLEMFSLI